MSIKKDKGLVGIDIVLALISIMIFSSLIFSTIYNNVIENIKLKKETLAMIYITEMFEKIAIMDYDDISSTDYNDIIPSDLQTHIDRGAYKELIVNVDEVGTKDILKKVDIKLTYVVNEKEYSCSMQRMKIKE